MLKVKKMSLSVLSLTGTEGRRYRNVSDTGEVGERKTDS